MPFLKELGIVPKDDIVHLYLPMGEACELRIFKVGKFSMEITT